MFSWSSESCSERSGVSAPIFAAAIWSIEVPASMSAPSVFFGRMPLSHAVCTRVWTPPPSLCVSAPLLLRPLSTTMSLRNGSSACSTGVIS